MDRFKLEETGMGGFEKSGKVFDEEMADIETTVLKEMERQQKSPALL
jgi:hypothetical protein